MNASVPIEATGLIPVAESDVAGIPPIALGIPDFEGQAILRIFGNSTESEIACYSALVTNGNTFSQPQAVGSVLGIFTIIAVIASFATAIYGDHIPTMRTHYAHSLSVLVVFEIFHHIYFTGALSLNWPSVLAAFWSNYAWSAGMIYSATMQASINRLVGTSTGNTTSVGAASSGAASNNVGGGYQISQIYKRSHDILLNRDVANSPDILQELRTRGLETALAKREILNATEGYRWYGLPTQDDLPLPGNYSGLAGTLSMQNIPAANAFMTGFLWLLILAVIILGLMTLFKLTLEGLNRVQRLPKDRLAFFRENWLIYIKITLLRIMLISFFMMLTLALFQFAYRGSVGSIAIAAIVFIIFFIGGFSIAAYACFFRLKFGSYATTPDRLYVEKTNILKFIPWFHFTRESQRTEKLTSRSPASSLPWLRVSYISEDPQRLDVNRDEDYIKNFGWLFARFRRTRWWFFAFWIVYQFVRACFYGGAAGQPLGQVFGLLVVEIIACIAIIVMKPFEGARLNALMVYCLSFSKITTLALAATFDATFNLPRIVTTVLGIVIIVIQGVLTIALLVAIAVGAVSTYMSLTRNREEFKPRKLVNVRHRYFAHLDQAATDLPPPPPQLPEEPKAPYFQVGSVRRIAKIEDEDEDNMSTFDPTSSRVSVAPNGFTRESRANSMRSTLSHANVPFGARVHRASWSSRDFNSWNDHSNRNSVLMSRNGIQSMKSNQSLRDAAHARSIPPSRSGSGPLEVQKRSRHGKEKELEHYPAVNERPSQENRPSQDQYQSQYQKEART